MNNSLRNTAMVLLSLIIAVSAYADSFDKIKTRLNLAGCVNLDFTSIVISDIFDTVDTLKGQAVISQDGRYDIELGSSRYTFDGNNSFSYSEENNQVVIESGDGSEDQVSFITRLDDLYKSTILVSDSRYKLVRSDTEVRDIPDSMTVWIDKEKLLIKKIEYLDVNDELNRIEINKTMLNSDCDSTHFKPVYPDSTERVRL